MTTRRHSEFNLPGGIYFLTTTLMGWKHVFIKKEYIEFIIESLRFFQNQKKVLTVGYCIMPNHVHWILKLGDDDMDIVKVLRTMKSFLATQLLKRLEIEVQNETLPLCSVFLGNNHISEESPRDLLEYFSRLAGRDKDQSHRFWQRDSDIKQILTPDFLRQKLVYIHNNPVQEKWGLVKFPEEYPYSSCRFYMEGSDWNGLRIQALS